MNEEKPSVATSTSTAPPPAYTSGPTHNPSQYPPQYGNPPQQQHKVTVVTTVPVRQPEVWISSRGAVPPPDRGRIVIGGEARYRYGQLTSTNYTYADELPCLASAMLVCIVCCFFVLSPISLVCSVSAYYFIKKVCNPFMTVLTITELKATLMQQQNK